MKIFSVLLTWCVKQIFELSQVKKYFSISAASIAEPKIGDCKWLHGNSGQHVNCLPGFYINGICGSGSRNDCRFLGDGM